MYSIFAACPVLHWVILLNWLGANQAGELLGSCDGCSVLQIVEGLKNRRLAPIHPCNLALSVVRAEERLIDW